MLLFTSVWNLRIQNSLNLFLRLLKVSFFFRRYYIACQIANICKHFTAPASVHRDSKMFAKIGDLTSSISSEKNLPLSKDELIYRQKFPKLNSRQVYCSQLYGN